MNVKLIIGALAVIIIGIVGGMYLPRVQNGGVATSTGSTERPLKTYYDQRYGIAFNFPDTYAVQERDSIGGTKHHVIVIGDKSALENLPENSEAPQVIEIAIFENPRNVTPEQWAKSESLSNYKLSPDGVSTPTKVAEKEAIAYGWDGLYTSNSIVFSHNKRIYMLSVGYNSPDDQLVKDFAKVVASVQLDP